MRKIYAEMWYCGDEECDCSQPKIIERSEGRPSEYGWKHPQDIEEGPFKSQPDREEYREQHLWLLEAARRHKVVNLAEIEEDYGWAERATFSAKILAIFKGGNSPLE